MARSDTIDSGRGVGSRFRKGLSAEDISEQCEIIVRVEPFVVFDGPRALVSTRKVISALFTDIPLSFDLGREKWGFASLVCENYLACISRVNAWPVMPITSLSIPRSMRAKARKYTTNRNPSLGKIRTRMPAASDINSTTTASARAQRGNFCRRLPVFNPPPLSTT